MQIAIRTIFFHFTCIIIFAILYFYLKDDFGSDKHEKFTMLDYFLLSTTVQAGVGISDIYPVSYYGKIIMIIQQLIMIMTHVFTVYIFTL